MLQRAMNMTRPRLRRARSSNASMKGLPLMGDALNRHAGRRPGIRVLIARGMRRRGWRAFARHDRWTWSGALRRLRHPAQHVMQDPTVLIVLDFDHRIDAAGHRHGIHLAVRSVDYQ